MKAILVALVTIVGLSIYADSGVAAEPLRPTDDHFESRRRDQKWREDVRRQQELSKRRQIPTFTIPQPSFVNPGFDPRFGNNRRFGDPRFRDPRFNSGQYVYIPGHYQIIGGQYVYVPPHYQYMPSYLR